MYLPPKDAKNNINIRGLKGLPEHYPVPYDVPDVLFYIQRNQNPNTVIYQINKLPTGEINRSEPLYVFWKQYDNDGMDKPLNYIQRKLAYGYETKEINPDVFELSIISYPNFKMFLTSNDDGKYRALGKLDGEWAELCNVYVFAEQTGAFPVVKYIELYCCYVDSGMPCYKRIMLD